MMAAYICLHQTQAAAHAASKGGGKPKTMLAAKLD
jgi:hypothetical protein